jgi:hypothetical protein
VYSELPKAIQLHRKSVILKMIEERAFKTRNDHADQKVGLFPCAQTEYGLNPRHQLFSPFA